MTLILNSVGLNEVEKGLMEMYMSSGIKAGGNKQEATDM